MTNSQLDTTNESQEVGPFPAGDHKAHINRRTQRHRKRKTEKKIHKRSTAWERSVKYFTGVLKPVLRRANLTLNTDVGQDKPLLIKNSNSIPDISDHSMVVTDSYPKPFYNKQKPKKVFLYAKANWNNIHDEMLKLSSAIIEKFNAGNTHTFKTFQKISKF